MRSSHSSHVHHFPTISVYICWLYPCDFHLSYHRATSYPQLDPQIGKTRTKPHEFLIILTKSNVFMVRPTQNGFKWKLNGFSGLLLGKTSGFWSGKPTKCMPFQKTCFLHQFQHLARQVSSRSPPRRLSRRWCPATLQFCGGLSCIIWMFV